MPDSTTNAARQEARLLFLHAQTSLHPGSGTALGTVDLPVQRERHTDWPIIPGSALKGILRDVCRERCKINYDGNRKKANEEDKDLTAAFGPGKVDDSSSFAGALSITDARILAFPVRSLKGVFAWVTCPAVLERLHRDLQLAGTTSFPTKEIPHPLKLESGDQAACPKDSPLLIDGNKLILEEFEFTKIAELGSLASWIADRAILDEITRKRLNNHLVVLNDDDFNHFVRHATEVVARVALDYERKTVKQGALFYQEFLPAETLFYSLVLANPSRAEKHPKTATAMLAYLEEQLPAGTVLQIGGDETTGKGLCVVRLSNGK